MKTYNTYGTGRVNGYKIMEETLNLRDVRIFDYIEDGNGRKTAVLNKKETAIAQSKQELIKQAFSDWIWSDPERREQLTKLYNEKFNSSERAERVRNKMVDSSVDNMLLITNDGRKLALDQRLMNDMLPDSEASKVGACAQNVFDIWQRTADRKTTQMVFCDLSTPHGDGKFNVYDDLRDKLIAKGVPSEEIAYIHTANSEAQKKYRAQRGWLLSDDYAGRHGKRKEGCRRCHSRALQVHDKPRPDSHRSVQRLRYGTVLRHLQPGI